MSNRSPVSTASQWRPTAAHLRALLGGLLLCIVAVLARRPDLLVLATPLVGAAVWGSALRPAAAPTITQSIAHSTLREGQATTWRIGCHDAEGYVEDVAVVLGASPWIDRYPDHGQVAASPHDAAHQAVHDDTRQLEIVVESTRWGRRRIDPAVVVASSAWGAFQWHQPGQEALALLTLPQPAPFDASAPPVRTPGLIGVNRSPRQGSGTEFAGIRPFQPGDRLRRIHWPRSVRTGQLHVTTTWADHDRQVLLLIDALDDVGESGGIHGHASSLDIGVRATGAIAEHFVAVGDRVGLVALGVLGVQRVPAAAGFRHLRRLLEVMATIEPARVRGDDGRLPRGLTAGALVVVLSPLLSAAALRRVRALAERGMTTVVIDCLPQGIAHQADDDPFVAITWRIELLRRHREIRAISEAGIPVVPWRGPGSLDMVLRDLHDRSRSGMRARR